MPRGWPRWVGSAGLRLSARRKCAALLGDLDDDPAAHRAFDNPPASAMTPARSISLVIVASLPASISDANRFQASRRRSRGHITESMPMSDTPRRMKGATVAGKSIPPANPQAAIAPP